MINQPYCHADYLANPKKYRLFTRVPQLIRQVTDFIRYDSKTLHYKRESCCAVVGFFTPSA